MQTLGRQIMQFDKKRNWLPTSEQLRRIASSPTVIYCQAHHLPLGGLQKQLSRM
jgi:hypothetical protein